MVTSVVRNVPGIWAIFDPFEGDVWLCICCTAVIVGLTFMVLEGLFAPDSEDNPRAASALGWSYKASWSVYYAFTALLADPADFALGSQIAHFLKLGFMFFILVWTCKVFVLLT